MDEQEHDRALAEVRRQATRRLLTVVSVIAALLFITIAAGGIIAVRAQAAAPRVIEEIAVEKQAALETRIDARTEEARKLATELFSFLLVLWDENEAMRGVRTNIDAATNQVRLLTGELNLALDSPTKGLGPLLENGPTRAKAVFEYAIAIAEELAKLVPMVLDALKHAKAAADSTDKPALEATLLAMDELLAPFLGGHEGLNAQWTGLKTNLRAFVQHVWDDLDAARAQMSGDALSAEFMLRLRDAVF